MQEKGPADRRATLKAISKSLHSLKPKIKQAALKALEKVITQILHSVQAQLVVRVLDQADGYIESTQQRIQELEAVMLADLQQFDERVKPFTGLMDPKVKVTMRGDPDAISRIIIDSLGLEVKLNQLALMGGVQEQKQMDDALVEEQNMKVQEITDEEWMRMLDQIDSQKKPEKWKGPGKKLEIILRAEQRVYQNQSQWVSRTMNARQQGAFNLQKVGDSINLSRRYERSNDSQEVLRECEIRMQGFRKLVGCKRIQSIVGEERNERSRQDGEGLQLYEWFEHRGVNWIKPNKFDGHAPRRNQHSYAFFIYKAHVDLSLVRVKDFMAQLKWKKETHGLIAVEIQSISELGK